MKGWLPVEITLDTRPALVSDAVVRWVEFGSTPLSEPFLKQTVDKLREAEKLKDTERPAREIDTDLESMTRAASRLPRSSPAGFIFHISRCGSTLIANALKTVEGVQVLSESIPLTELLLPLPLSTGPFLTERWNRKRRALVESIFAVFACYRTGEPQPLVIKFTSINILCMSMIRSYWPEVPCVVVVRDPVEVMVASLSGGGWMSLKSKPQLARDIFGWDRSVTDMSDVEYSARVLERYFSSAAEALNETCMVVDYEDLNPKRMREIAAFFNIELPREGGLVDRVFSLYAKDPDGQEKFADDRSQKQQLATSEIREAARRLARPAYAELRGRAFR